MYEGKVIPAPVAVQLERLRQEEIARKNFMEEKKNEAENSQCVERIAD